MEVVKNGPLLAELAQALFGPVIAEASPTSRAVLFSLSIPGTSHGEHIAAPQGLNPHMVHLAIA